MTDTETNTNNSANIRAVGRRHRHRHSASVKPERQCPRRVTLPRSRERVKRLKYFAFPLASNVDKSELAPNHHQ
jgi:hypothetical protein